MQQDKYFTKQHSYTLYNTKWALFIGTVYYPTKFLHYFTTQINK